MKVLLYTEGLKQIEKSGLGKAIKHQLKALEENHIEHTTDPNDTYDLVHINFYGPNSYSLAKKAKKEGKKVIYHAHSTEEDFKNSFLFSNQIAPIFKWWITKCYNLGDKIITPTPYSKKLLESYDTIKAPIVALSNGIDVSFFERQEKNGKAFRKFYGYKDSDKVIVGIGLYIERKGILDFVELASRMPEYQFIWFGYSPLSASPVKIREAVNRELANLHFAGYVEPTMIRDALSGADLYLFPTLEETEGIPIIEACAAKIPALIRDIPVFSDWLEDEKNVYKAKDLEEFEEKIKGILEGKLKSLVEEGYKVAQERDLKIIGKKLIEIYKSVLNNSDE